MFITSAVKYDLFAAAESIHETRYGYAETKSNKIAASCEDMGTDQSKIAATRDNFAASAS